MSNAVPVVGSDDGTWGTILNQFLAVSLDVTTGYLLTGTSNQNVTNFPSLYPSGQYWTSGNNPNYAQTSSPGIVQLAGDLAGTATSPKVVQIQGFPVSSTTPTTGQVLEYTGSTWAATTGAFVSTNGGSNITMPSGAVDGLDITLGSSSTGNPLVVYDSIGYPYFTIPIIGGPRVISDHIGAQYGIYGQEISFDGTTNPPSLSMGNSSANHLWFLPGTPSATTISSGTIVVNDLAYDINNQTWYVATTGGTPSASVWAVSGGAAATQRTFAFFSMG
jgi:hypothetical protein